MEKMRKLMLLAPLTLPLGCSALGVSGGAAGDVLGMLKSVLEIVCGAASVVMKLCGIVMPLFGS